MNPTCPPVEAIIARMRKTNGDLCADVVERWIKRPPTKRATKQQPILDTKTNMSYGIVDSYHFKPLQDYLEAALTMDWDL